MACACKTAKQIQQKNKLYLNEKKGFKYFINIFLDGFLQIISKIFVCLLFAILTPLIILFLIFSFLFKGNLRIVLPKRLIKVLKRIETNGEEL